MSVPISQRLLCCAAMVPEGSRVADVGADHGYLGIYLLQTGIAQFVAACDLREGPLENARRNAKRCHIQKYMAFYLSDGLQAVPKDAFDTVVCAGMGGDLIIKILSQSPWLQHERYTLILQPQTDIQSVRVWLGKHGFYEDKADLVRDGGFLYCALRARFGGGMTLTPGQQFISPALLASASPLLGEYMTFLKNTMNKIIGGLSRADTSADPARLQFYQTALRELEEMEAKNGKDL